MMNEQASLFDRLGGAEKIGQIVDDIIAAHQANPLVKVRFEGIEEPDLVRQHAYEFFVSGTGGALPYTGRDMRTTHTGMNISEQEYIAVLDDILGVLGAHNVGETEERELLSVLYGIKGEIIRV